jgi:formylglycine-generating enzyme required for sulfatase activity
MKIKSKFIILISIFSGTVFIILFIMLLKSNKIKTTDIGLGNGIKMDFILIHAGTFNMGSGEDIGEEDETPRHKVTISQPYYIGKYEVTQEQWESIMGSNPSFFKGSKLPVDTVS